MAQSVMVNYGHLPMATAIATPTSPVTYAVTQQHPTNQRVLPAPHPNMNSTSNMTTATTTAPATGRGTKRSLAAAMGSAECNASTPIEHSAAARCKRRIQFASLGYVQLPPALPASVARRNARERNRVKQVNSGFAVLRSHIPTTFCTSASSKHSNSSGNSSSSGKGRKVSKVDTLRCAVEYIRSLQELLDESDNLVMAGAAATQPGFSNNENKLPSQPHHAPNPSSVLNSPPLSHSHFLSSSASSVSSQTSTPLLTNSSLYHPHPAAASAAAGLLNPATLVPHSLSPSCSSNASSPTPSYGSEGSSYITTPSWDHYEPCYTRDSAGDVTEPLSASDDELLDAISWWQQSQ